MNLSKARNDIKKMKKEIGDRTEPTLDNFFKFCEKEYGYKATFGEIYFSSYYTTDGLKVESNAVKFVRLSEKFYNEMHQAPNPVKDGKYSLKWRAVMHWTAIKDKGHISQKRMEDIMQNDIEFNQWYEDAWNEIIVNGDCSKYNQLVIDSKDVF